MSENKTKTKPTEKKEKGDSTVKICMGVASLVVFAPVMFPTMVIPSATFIATCLKCAGVACVSGVGTICALETVKEMRKDKVEIDEKLDEVECEE